MKNHTDNSKCHPTLKKEKHKDFKKMVKRNKFNTFFFFFVIVKFNITSIVIQSINFLKKKLIST